MPLPFNLIPTTTEINDVIRPVSTYIYESPFGGFIYRFDELSTIQQYRYRDNSIDEKSFAYLLTQGQAVSPTRNFNLPADEITKMSVGFYNSIAFASAISVRASLTQALEAVVTDIQVSTFNSTTDTITVTFDKPTPLVVFIRELNGSNAETGQCLTAAEGIAGGTTIVKTVTIPKQLGRYRIIVPTGQNSAAKDYLAQTELTALSSYSPSTSVTIVNEYPQGVLDGRRAFAEAIYPIGDVDGFNSTSVLAGNNWDTSLTRQSFRDTIANVNSINASKTFLNALVARGATSYNGSSLVPSYYTGLAVSSSQEVLDAGGVAAYKAVYNEYTPFAIAFPAYPSSTNGTFLNGLKDDFVALITTDKTNLGYQNAGADIKTAIASYETTAGLPESKSAYAFTGTYNSTEFGNAARHIYNAGSIKTAQLLYDEGLLNGFDWRNNVSAYNLIDANPGQQFRDLSDDYKLQIQSTAKRDGLKVFLERIRTQYSYTYDNTNSGNLSDTAYTAYLETLRDSAISKVFDNGGIASYQDIYNTAVTNFGFTYNPSQTSAQLALLKNGMFTAVNSWGIVSALQDSYNLATATYFDEQTNYQTIKNSSIVYRAPFMNTLANQMKNLQGDYYTRVYEWGAIYTYRERLYPYAIPYGFTFSTTEQIASYYANKEQEFIDSLSQGFGVDGIKYVYNKAVSDYGWTYNTSLTNITALKALASPMLEFVHNKGSLETKAYGKIGETADGRWIFQVRLNTAAGLLVVYTTPTGDLLDVSFSNQALVTHTITSPIKTENKDRVRAILIPYVIPIVNDGSNEPL